VIFVALVENHIHLHFEVANLIISTSMCW